MSLWKTLFARYAADSYDEVRMDASTNSLQIVDYPHHEIHAGSCFSASETISVDTTTQKWMITTPDTTKYAHTVFNFVCTGEMAVTVTEGADRTGTTSLDLINRNRNSSTAATVAVHRNYTGGSTDGATTIWRERTGATGAGSQTSSAGQSRSVSEFVLKRNTKYIIAVETFANVYVSINLLWYEHTDAN